MTRKMTSNELILEHYGVKGMQWGVRKDSNRSAKKEAKKANKAWKKQAKSSEKANEVYNDAIKSMGPKIKAINNDPLFSGKDLTQNPRLARQYETVVAQALQASITQSSLKLNTNPAGDRAYVFQMSADGRQMRAVPFKKAEHGEIEGIPDFNLERDDKGFITSISVGTLTHSIDDILEHYGVKGMQWGVRRSAAQLKRARQERQAARAPSEDKKRHEANCKKGSAALSDKELQAVNNRLNQEQQFSRMNPSTVKKGSNIVKGVLAVGATAQTAYSLATSPMGKKIAESLQKKSK